MPKGLWIDDKTFVPFTSGSRSLSAEIATRAVSIDFFSLGIFLPNPDPVLKKMGKDIHVYRDLLVDGRVGAGVINRKGGTKALNWEVDRNKAASRQAKIIEDAIKALDVERIITEILDAPLYGYQVLEVIWEKRGGLILPKDVVGKPQEWFVFGPENNELRFRTRFNWNGDPLPDKKFLLPRHNATYQNPYGEPILAKCFWPVTFKKGGWKFWVTFTEKFGMPFLVGKTPRGTNQTEVDKLAAILEQMIQDAIAVIPDDSSIEVLGAGGKGGTSSAGTDIYRGLIEEANLEISAAILGHAGASVSTPGRLGNEETAEIVRKAIVDGDKKMVEATINQLISWIYEFNFPGGEQPTFGLYAEESVDKTLAERDKTLTETGVRFNKSYFTNAYGFADSDFEIGPPTQGGGGAGPSNLLGDSLKSAFAEFASKPSNPDDWIALYMDRLRPFLQNARSSALDEIESWLNDLSTAPSEAEFQAKVMDALGTSYDFSNLKAIKDTVSEIYQNVNAGKGIAAVFGGPDKRAIDFLSKLDNFYVSKWIDNPDMVNAVQNFLSERYLTDGAALFGRGSAEDLQAFRDLFSQKLGDLEDWQVRRIIDTSVTRTQNWAALSQLNDGGITTIRVYEPTQECDFCKAMNGKTIDVPTAYNTMVDQANMSPAEYEAALKAQTPVLANIESFVQGGLLPPYHPHCRGIVIKAV